MPTGKTTMIIWITRDLNGRCALFTDSKPELDDGQWVSTYGCDAQGMPVMENAFPVAPGECLPCRVSALKPPSGVDTQKMRACASSREASSLTGNSYTASLLHAAADEIDALRGSVLDDRP